MKISHLVIREIRHRKLNFAASLLAVGVAVGVLVAADSLLIMHHHRQTKFLSDKEADLSARLVAKEKDVELAGKVLQEAMRTITKGLGFNILILPEDEDLARFQVEGVAASTMPETHVSRLANSKIVTVNHLLPVVTKRIEWLEQEKLEVILIGTRGEATLAHRDPKKPLLERVPRGKMEIGFQVAQKRGLIATQAVTLMGRDFTISKVHAERGDRDDSTIWINLGEAQELFGMENLVNAILALECNCNTINRVAEIRAEIAGILPGTKVVERGSKALARAEARNEAKVRAVANLARERESSKSILDDERAKAGQFMERFRQLSDAIVIGAMLGGLALLALLAFDNTHRRQSEIGILRALGLRAGQVLQLFLGKACLVGLLGALLGCVLGLVAAMAFGDASNLAEAIDPSVLAVVFLVAPLIAVMGSWIPAVMAARRDPASILQEE
ncbi:MAG: FtsX-like permease family protein [Planctomycetota bacterium]|jgi:hypothetical protein|nr:FtsX-like permease family protein [Planctomycetota bacterium]